MASKLKKIREQFFLENDKKVETICNLGNALLNMQHMLIRQAIYIIMSFPLYSTSRKTIFFNTCLTYKRTYVLKKPNLLQKEANDSYDS